MEPHLGILAMKTMGFGEAFMVIDVACNVLA